MVDDKMALTFSVRSNPGTFALLLGSGVSTESEVLSGWGILNDLIRKVAAVEDEDPGTEPTEWYQEKYGEEPGYDDILEQLAQSKEERQALLEPYFEPTEEEREQGVKTPSDAHHSIAWLVDEGYIDVIVTTNFDRLIEQALENRGVTPTRISTVAAAEGATPLRHEEEVILKINGDYKETNIKNTSTELEEYDPAIRRLIDQVFDEYGLIICGWSGKYDSALREAILECESRRYSTFWAYHGDLEDEAEELVEHRDGTAIQIDGASPFFSELKENVQALEDAESGAPLTRDIVRERVKRYMTRDEQKIELADLIQDETNRVRVRVFDESRFPLDVDFDSDAVQERLERYETAVETLVVACSTCAYWGPEVVNPASKHLAKAVRRLGNVPRPDGRHYDDWKRLRYYPGTILLHAVGAPAVASEDWDLVYDVLVGTDITVFPRTGGELTEPAVIALHPSRYETSIPTNMIGSGTNVAKNRVRNCIQEPIREFMPDEDRFESAFYRFEALSDMVVYDRCREIEAYRPFVPNSPRGPGVIRDLVDEFEVEGDDWGPLQAGLFEGSRDRLELVIDAFE